MNCVRCGDVLQPSMVIPPSRCDVCGMLICVNCIAAVEPESDGTDAVVCKWCDARRTARRKESKHV